MLDFFNAEHLAMIPPIWVYSGVFVICILEGAPVIGSLVAGGTITFMIGSMAAVGVVDPIVGNCSSYGWVV
jgi:membrane protein DedA with SNARE-associated domain